MAPEVKSDNPIKPIRRDSNKLNQIFFIVFLMLIATMTFIYIRDKVRFLFAGYQWRVAKQWCLLCLAVQGVVVFSSLNVLTHNFLFPFHHLSPSFLINVILLYFIPALTWYAAKPNILRLQQAKNIKREYLRMKFNTDIFHSLLKK